MTKIEIKHTDFEVHIETTATSVKEIKLAIQKALCYAEKSHDISAKVPPQLELPTKNQGC